MLWLSAQPVRLDELPPIAREFRAAWVATVDNIDWPSSRNLSSASQQRELVAIFDRAVALHLNAIILQVRPSADALYDSKLEPWSEFLTGRQGVGPTPAYDPLQFAVEEAHRRGLALHCWLNPYRAKHPAQKGPLAANHLAVTDPALVKTYGKYLWMDPGEPGVQLRTLAVVKDLVQRYDIDGIHIDDYFYPYKEVGQEFPDGPSFQKYLQKGGQLGRDDWRRKNVDDMVRAMYETIKKTRRSVLFGVSPFGIYRPGIPVGIKAGVDQYAELYADARKWLREGWCDYFSPQLYWPISQTAQSYPVLLSWWIGENVMKRHLWPGNFTSRTLRDQGNWPAVEVVNQVKLTEASAATGNIHFSMKALMRNPNGVSDALRGGPYAQRALIPESPWLDSRAPLAPSLVQTASGFEWENRGKEPAMWWAVWRRYGNQWLSDVLPGKARDLDVDLSLKGIPLAEFAVEAVDRLGNASSPSRIKVR